MYRVLLKANANLDLNIHVIISKSMPATCNFHCQLRQTHIQTFEYVRMNVYNALCVWQRTHYAHNWHGIYGNINFTGFHEK